MRRLRPQDGHALHREVLQRSPLHHEGVLRLRLPGHLGLGGLLRGLVPPLRLLLLHAECADGHPAALHARRRLEGAGRAAARPHPRPRGPGAVLEADGQVRGLDGAEAPAGGPARHPGPGDVRECLRAHEAPGQLRRGGPEELERQRQHAELGAHHLRRGHRGREVLQRPLHRQPDPRGRDAYAGEGGPGHRPQLRQLRGHDEGALRSLRLLRLERRGGRRAPLPSQGRRLPLCVRPDSRAVPAHAGAARAVQGGGRAHVAEAADHDEAEAEESRPDNRRGGVELCLSGLRHDAVLAVRDLDEDRRGRRPRDAHHLGESGVLRPARDHGGRGQEGLGPLPERGCRQAARDPLQPLRRGRRRHPRPRGGHHAAEGAVRSQ
mmetsp:Transcript_99712/g.310587  ORF Transcript_99712/g.310587 Transcript_99712/m.310587 type:complete len:379 (+) Transcript_99712:99-1235(+)